MRPQLLWQEDLARHMGTWGEFEVILQLQSHHSSHYFGQTGYFPLVKLPEAKLGVGLWVVEAPAGGWKAFLLQSLLSKVLLWALERGSWILLLVRVLMLWSWLGRRVEDLALEMLLLVVWVRWLLVLMENIILLGLSSIWERAINLRKNSNEMRRSKL